MNLPLLLQTKESGIFTWAQPDEKTASRTVIGCGSPGNRSNQFLAAFGAVAAAFPGRFLLAERYITGTVRDEYKLPKGSYIAWYDAIAITEVESYFQQRMSEFPHDTFAVYSIERVKKSDVFDIYFVQYSDQTVKYYGLTNRLKPQVVPPVTPRKNTVLEAPLAYRMRQEVDRMSFDTFIECLKTLETPEERALFFTTYIDRTQPEIKDVSGSPELVELLKKCHDDLSAAEGWENADERRIYQCRITSEEELATEIADPKMPPITRFLIQEKFKLEQYDKASKEFLYAD